MANSVHQDRRGGVWPLGNIIVAVAGTPVRITSLVDAAAVNAPETPTPGTAGADEYSCSAQQIIFQAFKPGAGPPSLAVNAGNIYILRKGAGAGTGNATDKGTIVACVTPGQTFTLVTGAMDRNVFNLYDFYLDADTSADACQVTAIVQ